MFDRKRSLLLLPMILSAVSLLVAIGPADAYGGPGAGLSAIGAFFALIGSIFFVIAGFVWYPAKRVIRWAKRNRREGSGSSD